MKKLTIFALVLAMLFTMAACGCKHEWLAATCETPKTCELCGETEGEAKGHSVVAATCEEAEHCENCNYESGEPLGHSWVDATTEAPKTCETCGTTEGERIITDSRFTTAATLDLQGKWIMELPIDGEMMGLPDFPSGAAMYISLNFSNAGDLEVGIEVSDSFAQLLTQYTVNMVYEEFAAQGMDKDAADAMFESTYGTSVQAYVEQEIENTDFTDIFNAAMAAANVGGVYYVEDGQLYTGESWEDEMTAEGFTLAGDTLSVESFEEVFETDGVFTRVVE